MPPAGRPPRIFKIENIKDRIEAEYGCTEKEKIEVQTGYETFPRPCEIAEYLAMPQMSRTCIAASCLSPVRYLQGKKHPQNRRELE